MLSHQLNVSGTPCPIPPAAAQQRRFRHSSRGSLVSATNAVEEEEDTGTIEFTSAFRESWRATKPRRRQTQIAATSTSRHGSEFAIHEDAIAVSGVVGEASVGGGRGARGVKPALARPARRGVISQPPQRPKNNITSSNKNRVSFAGTAGGETHPAPAWQSSQSAGSKVERSSINPRRLSQAPRRPVIVPTTTTAMTEERRLDPLTEDDSHDDEGYEDQAEGAFETTIGMEDFTAAAPTMTMTMPTMPTMTLMAPKPARRGTIYIPNDDTTMPSMYMGIFSPIKDLEARRMAHQQISEPGDGLVEADLSMDITGIAAQMARKRVPHHYQQQKQWRHQANAVAPTPAPLSPKRTIPPPAAATGGRGALQTTRRNVQGQAVVEDRWGQGGGKENVPPGGLAMNTMACTQDKAISKGSSVLVKGLQVRNLNLNLDLELDLDPDLDLDLPRPSSMNASDINTETNNKVNIMPTKPTTSKPYAQTASSLSRMAEKKTTTKKSTSEQHRPNHIWNNNNNRKEPRGKPLQHSNASTATTSLHNNEYQPTRRPKPAVPTRFVVPQIAPTSISTFSTSTTAETRSSSSYPLLQDGLAHPAMYEDNWLQHQEIAITQLVNNLFSISSPGGQLAVHDGSGNGVMDIQQGMEIEQEVTLRGHLLASYADAEMAILYKRLQAAMLYGALSLPTEVLKGASRLHSDLGRRKAFTDFWLETYDLACLRSALEVVVGRECSGARGSSPSTRRSDGGVGDDASRPAVQRFIELFLIRNEDGRADDTSAASDRASWSYQRTVLRSLMLIKLLDTTKASTTTASPVLNGCLFRVSSTYKSSVGVVKGLFQLLNPSAGDPIRVLNHIGYHVTHLQYPLEEYTYSIDNLAVDLRDGVRLTRLVELLLYPSASRFVSQFADSDSTTTVLLPTGEVLSLTEGERDWPLSQHLKFPCLGRATKLYNVQIALSALQGVKGMAALLGDISPEDIVDGFREKTVKLLWGLTSKWGLCGLVDWEDVEREIKRLCRATGDHDNDFFDLLEDEDGHARYKMLLKSWAQAVASKDGIVVKNLTTSFSDGRVFEAIVDEYERYLTCDKSFNKSRPLSERLRRLGCSEQFAGLFSTSESSAIRTHIFDRDFILAALAFLCSRLLGPSKAGRAAVTIQKAWRQHWGRVVGSRKRWLKTVAEGCADAAQGRERARQMEEQTQLCHAMDRAGLDGQQQMKSPERTEEDIWLNL